MRTVADIESPVRRARSPDCPRLALVVYRTPRGPRHRGPHGQNMQAWPSLRRLAEWTGLHRSTVAAVVATLTTEGPLALFVLEPGGSLHKGHRTSNRYTLRAERLVAHDDQSPRTTSRPGRHDRSPRATRLVAHDDTEGTKKGPLNVNTPPIPPASGGDFRSLVKEATRLVVARDGFAAPKVLRTLREWARGGASLERIRWAIEAGTTYPNGGQCEARAPPPGSPPPRGLGKHRP